MFIYAVEQKLCRESARLHLFPYDFFNSVASMPKAAVFFLVSSLSSLEHCCRDESVIEAESSVKARLFVFLSTFSWQVDTPGSPCISVVFLSNFSNG